MKNGVPSRSSRLLCAFAVKVLLAGCAPLRLGPAAPATLPAALDAIFADTALAHAHWGVLVRSLDTNRVLYEKNSARLYVPASNVKSITSAAVLDVLGAGYRYRTQVLATGPVRNGVLHGDLVVVGGGDPTISARFHDGDARAVFRAWADSLRVRGIQRVAGAVLTVDTAFSRARWGPGWAWDDLDAGYSAEVSALSFNEGVVVLRVFPGDAVGQPGIVSLDPATGYVGVDNRTRTVEAGAPARLEVERDPQTAAITLAGDVPLEAPALTRTLAVRNVTQYFGVVLRETLREQGVMVEGPVLDGMEWPERVAETARGALLFTHASPPLREIVPAFMKPSQNQVAEALVRTLGREQRGSGSTAAGTAVVDSVLATTFGLTTHRRAVADGSGLSRFNLLSPVLLADLYTAMAAGPHAELWTAAQPVAGVDGTLASRLRGTPAEGRVMAKTGTLRGVRALSGYVTTAAGERLVFSILVNNHARTAADVDRVIDAALLRLVAEPRVR